MNYIHTYYINLILDVYIYSDTCGKVSRLGKAVEHRGNEEGSRLTPLYSRTKGLCNTTGFDTHTHTTNTCAHIHT